MSDAKRWIEETTHEIKVLILSRLNADMADFRPSDAYKMFGRELIDEGDRLAASAEKRQDLAN